MEGNNADGDLVTLRLVDRPWFPYLCTEVEHWQWETPGAEHYNFWAVLSGSGYLRCNGLMFALRAGRFFIFPPQCTISAAHYTGPRITRFSAHFLPHGAGSADPSWGSGVKPRVGMVWSLPVFERRIAALMRVAMRRCDDGLLASMLQDLLRDCLRGTASEPSQLIDPRVARAMERIREDPSSIGEIDGLAREVGLSRSHFDRLFARQTGQAPKQFLLNCKIIRARGLLESSALRVGEIAGRLGYRDIYFFSRQFKQATGQSPQAYRRSLRGGPRD